MRNTKESVLEPSHSFRTSRLNFAATLLALGHELCDVQHGTHGLTFCFPDDGEMDDRYEAYVTGKLQVPAMKFVRAQDLLRDLRRARSQTGEPGS